MIRATQLKVNVEKDRDKAIRKKICKQFRIAPDQLGKVNIRKLSVDARNKKEIKWVCNVEFEAKGENTLLKKNKNLEKATKKNYQLPTSGEQAMKNRPVVIGFGPAGMFAALILTDLGYKPIIVERGEAVEERTISVNEFWRKATLNSKSNVQFGEGGAGTFSDGKLTTRIKDIRCQKVLEYLVNSGAPEEILYTNKPHIGTDILKNVVKNIRNHIVSKGGEVRFNTQAVDFLIDQNTIEGIKLDTGEVLETTQVILAIGHSARDTFELLKEKKMELTPKPFAIGARIEHPQWLIDQSQYGDEQMRDILGAADYALTHQASNGRSVYTFCMCPGGMVVASASEEGQVVTNGMSEYSRNEKNANSALLVNVKPEDFNSEDPLAGMYFQRKLEEKAFELAGSNYYAPVIRLKDFLGKTTCKHASLNEEVVQPSYMLGTKTVDFNELFPEYIIDAMKEGIEAFGKRIKGFDMDQGIMTAVETRTSSPIRIARDQESLESTKIKGVYPCGEGAGYAGGIISSAVDGIKCAEKIIEQHQAFTNK